MSKSLGFAAAAAVLVVAGVLSWLSREQVCTASLPPMCSSSMGKQSWVLLTLGAVLALAMVVVTLWPRRKG